MALVEFTLVGLAALMTAAGGVASTILALRRARSEEQEQCLERLAEVRKESEKLAAELHELRMKDAT